MRTCCLFFIVYFLALSGCAPDQASQSIQETVEYDAESGEEIVAESLESYHDEPADAAFLNLTDPEVIDFPIKEDSLLFNYLQSPKEFETMYNLDELYRIGINITDISEQEVICFAGAYSDDIVMGIKLGDSIESVKKKLGEPQFSDTELGYIGYRTDACYFAVEGKTSIESMVFTKNYKLPDNYENIINDYLEHNGNILEKYSEYSFYGQLARGGSSIIYPFGIDFHNYTGLVINIHTNFNGVIPESENIVYTMKDSNESRLRSYFYHNMMFDQDATVVSPDGRKEAFEQTMISLYEYNNIYVYSLDHSFAPRVFRPGYWIGDQMYWLNNDALLYCGLHTLGVYSVEKDCVYDLTDEIDAMDINIQAVDVERCRIEGEADGRMFMIDYDLSDGFTFEFRW